MGILGIQGLSLGPGTTWARASPVLIKGPGPSWTQWDGPFVGGATPPPNPSFPVGLRPPGIYHTIFHYVHEYSILFIIMYINIIQKS